MRDLDAFSVLLFFASTNFFIGSLFGSSVLSYLPLWKVAHQPVAYFEESAKDRKELGNQQVKKDSCLIMLRIFGSSINSTWMNHLNQVCLNCDSYGDSIKGKR